jgi:dynein heavy chain
MYLLPIFSSKDIVAQLPEEGIMFSEIDSTFRKSMQGVFREPRVREMAGAVSSKANIYSSLIFENV